MELAITVPGDKTSGGNVTVSDANFAHAFNESLVHQVVTAYLAGSRQGTVAQKNRSAVSGGGKKPWRQKGTGNARAGTIRSPIWRGGGVTFAATNQNHSQKVNKKMYRAGLRSIVSELVRQERFTVIDALNITEPKTKQMVTLLADLGVMDKKSVLFIDNNPSDNLFLAARNLHWVTITDVAGIDPAMLVRHQHVFITKDAVSALEERLQ